MPTSGRAATRLLAGGEEPACSGLVAGEQRRGRCTFCRFCVHDRTADVEGVAERTLARTMWSGSIVESFQAANSVSALSFSVSALSSRGCRIRACGRAGAGERARCWEHRSRAGRGARGSNSQFLRSKQPCQTSIGIRPGWSGQRRKPMPVAGWRALPTAPHFGEFYVRSWRKSAKAISVFSSVTQQVPLWEQSSTFIPQRLLRFQNGFDRSPSLQTARFGGCSLVRAVEAVRWPVPRVLGGSHDNGDP